MSKTCWDGTLYEYGCMQFRKWDDGSNINESYTNPQSGVCEANEPINEPTIDIE